MGETKDETESISGYRQTHVSVTIIMGIGCVLHFGGFEDSHDDAATPAAPSSVNARTFGGVVCFSLLQLVGRHVTSRA